MLDSPADWRTRAPIFGVAGIIERTQPPLFAHFRSEPAACRELAASHPPSIFSEPLWVWRELVESDGHAVIESLCAAAQPTSIEKYSTRLESLDLDKPDWSPGGDHAIDSMGWNGSSSPKHLGPKMASASGVRIIAGTLTPMTLTRWP